MGCEPVIIRTNNVIISFPFHLRVTSPHIRKKHHPYTHTHTPGHRGTLDPIHFTLTITMTLNSLSKAE